MEQSQNSQGKHENWTLRRLQENEGGFVLLMYWKRKGGGGTAMCSREAVKDEKQPGKNIHKRTGSSDNSKRTEHTCSQPYTNMFTGRNTGLRCSCTPYMRLPPLLFSTPPFPHHVWAVEQDVVPLLCCWFGGFLQQLELKATNSSLQQLDCHVRCGTLGK